MYDIIIVGAGPAGSVCAKECAKYGLKTLVVERRQEIGVPVRCGEGLGEHWIKELGLKADSSWCRRKMLGAAVYAPSGKSVIVKNENTMGYIIERKIFEKKLAEEAIKAGARYMVKSQVYDVIKEDGFIKGVKIETPEEKLEIEGRLIIAADGVDSKTARYAGINTVADLKEVDSGYEYEMAGLNIPNPDLIHIYVGNRIAPRGYVWIFPKEEHVANVGVGIIGNDPKTAKEYLDSFIEQHPEIFENASPIEVKGGCIPVGKPLEKPYANGLLVIGDAARMVNPIHGGGMGNAMEAAILAAKTAKEAIDASDVSEEFLKKFAEEWYEIRGKQLLKIWKVRRFFEQLSDDDLNNLADFFDSEKLLEFTHGNKLEMFAKLFAKYPKIGLIAMRTLI